MFLLHFLWIRQNIENENNNNDEIFDKPLLDIYGNRTCILFEISKDVYQKF